MSTLPAPADRSKPALTPEQKARKRVTKIAKSGGDDMYSWALFVYGSVRYNGMSRTEAAWRRDKYIMNGEY